VGGQEFEQLMAVDSVVRGSVLGVEASCCCDGCANVTSLTLRCLI
jgi:hypothetical protein